VQCDGDQLSSSKFQHAKSEGFSQPVRGHGQT
jgi:hypothetical protein